MSEQEIDELLKEVEQENIIEIPEKNKDGVQEEEETEKVEAE
jgi:hypothetical protein